MPDDIDQFEADLRQRDAKKTTLISIVLLAIAAVFALGFAGVCVLVFVVVRDAENSVRIPTAAFWVPAAGAIFFGIAGFTGLREGLQKRRAARAFTAQAGAAG
jgi:hypothetical protein